jgi:hypothetical protein
MSRSVLVLGATGALGRLTATQFADAGWTVLHGARRPMPGVDYRLIDLDRPETLQEGLAGVDLIVNTIPDSDMRAETVVANSGGTLLNVAAGPLVDGLLARARCAAEPTGLVAMNGGLVPGITSVVATDLLQEHPSADEVEMVWTLTAQGYSGLGGRLWAHSYFVGRKRHPTFTVPLPDPYGHRRVLQIADSERGWLIALPSHVKVRTGVCLLERDTDAGFRLANALGLMTFVPQWLFANPPRRLTRGAVPGQGTPPEGSCTYWVAVYSKGERLTARTIEGEDDYLVTALAALCLGDALVEKTRGEHKAGIYSVEELLTLGDVLPSLTAHGVRLVRR